MIRSRVGRLPRSTSPAFDKERRVPGRGALYWSEGVVRAAYRSSGDPVGRDGDVGFRVVVSPFSS